MKTNRNELYELNGTVWTAEQKVKLIKKSNIDIGIFNVSDFVEKLWHNYKILRDKE